MFGRGFLFAEVVIVSAYAILYASLMYLRDFRNLVNAEMVLALVLTSIAFAIVSFWDRRFIGPLLICVSGISLTHGSMAIFSRLFANNMPAFIMGLMLFGISTIAGIVCGYASYDHVNEFCDLNLNFKKIAFRCLFIFSLASCFSIFYILSNTT